MSTFASTAEGFHFAWHGPHGQSGVAEGIVLLKIMQSILDGFKWMFLYSMSVVVIDSKYNGLEQLVWY